ncbi:hypothetical protein [Piscinibacter koreensis]|uniref:Uncharacterized protein n=1 Tax=Piscinibacter koreensis TaxID=2742824 RepID=A0A7Y6TYR6_9BURK|nr:hypothetical protein [Schlegelella koreensis]NUZ08494.1 hypothetical protein [Schlegelella koreensis]
MNKLLTRAALAALCAVGSMPTTAQDAQAGSSTGSAVTAAGQTPTKGSGIQYRSAFEGYARFTDEPVGSWKAANDNVGRIGGWRVYAKEAAAAQTSQGSQAGAPAAAAGTQGASPSAVTAPPSPAAPGSKPDPHQHH